MAASEVEIYCPPCHWVPDGGAHWQCSCGCVWNTFATAAECPQCQRRWPYTDCPTCLVRSPHLAWYHGLDALVEELVEETLPAPAAVCCTPNEP